MYGGYRRRGGFSSRGYYGRRQRFFFSDDDGGCLFCTGVSEDLQSHTRQQCSVFKQLKMNISPRPYVKAKLEERDEEGFAAAGFLLWKKGSEDKVEVLMARECRSDADNLNFLGGKRLRKTERAIEVALRKVDMECGHQLSREAMEGMKRAPLVHWSGQSSKFALFLFEVTSWHDCEVHVLAAGSRRDGVKRLEWVPCADLLSATFIHHELHDYAVEMVSTLSDPSCNVLRNMRELFEAAKSAVKVVKVADENEEKAMFDFDVISALISSAKLARGFSVTGVLNWGNIADAVKSLPKVDIRKVQLKFHPDRLGRQLQREPTDLEKQASTKAMQILNQILDMVKNPQTAPRRGSSAGGVFNTISELNELIKKYTCNTDDEDEEARVAAAVTAKLSEIKLR